MKTYCPLKTQAVPSLADTVTGGWHPYPTFPRLYFSSSFRWACMVSSHQANEWKWHVSVSGWKAVKRQGFLSILFFFLSISWIKRILRPSRSHSWKESGSCLKTRKFPLRLLYEWEITLLDLSPWNVEDSLVIAVSTTLTNILSRAGAGFSWRFCKYKESQARLETDWPRVETRA